MFIYCTERLHLSEAEAYLRITVARAAREHPVLLTMLRDGRMHLSGVAILLPLLTRENRDTVLARATHRSKRQIEELVAEFAPRPDVPSRMRKLPANHPTLGAPAEALVYGIRPGNAYVPSDPASSSGPSSAPAGRPELRPGGVLGPLLAAARTAVPVPAAPLSPTHRTVLEPLSPSRYKVQFTASAGLRDKLERLQALMRYEVPDGDLAAIIEKAVSEKLERLEARRFAKTSAPRKQLRQTISSPASRHIPAAVRRAVLERDGSRCGYIDQRGLRCSERHKLEFHHRHPFGMGGDHGVENVGLLCRAHNLLLAERDYGTSALSRRHRSGKPAAASSA